MDYEKIASGFNKLDNAIRDNASIQSVILEATSDIAEDQSAEKRPIIQSFLDAPMGDEKESVMKKAVAAAMVLAKDKGIITDVPNSSGAFAASIDDGMTRLKTCYQVGIGMIEPEEAIDSIVDHAETRAVAFVDYAFDSGIVRETVAEGVTKLAYLIPEIGPVVGPVVEHFKPVIKNLVARVEEPVKNFIKAGVRKVSTAVKKVAHTAVVKVKSIAGKIAKGIASLFS